MSQLRMAGKDLDELPTLTSICPDLPGLVRSNCSPQTWHDDDTDSFVPDTRNVVESAIEASRQHGVLWTKLTPDVPDRFRRWGRACLAGLAFAVLVGCKNQQQNQNVMTFLKDGKANGHLVIAGTPKIHAGASTDFYFGADLNVAFDGNIDFADSVRHVGPIDGPPEP